MTDTGFNNVVVTTPLPIGADAPSGSQNAGSALKVISSLRPILQLMNISFDGTEWHYENVRYVNWDVVPAGAAEVGEIIIDNTEEAIPPAVYMHIPRSGTPLFPNLTRLRLVNEPLHSSLYHLPLFFSPRLHSLEIDNICQDDIPALDCFLRNQASLKHVILGPMPYSPRIMQAISGCKFLEIVTLSFLSSKPLGDEVIYRLGTMPKLQNLTIKADHVPYTLSKYWEGFVALRDVCIIGVYSFVEAILTAAEGSAAIHTLKVTISSDWATKSPSPFCPQADPRYPWGPATLPPKIETLLSLVAKEWSSSLYNFTLVVDPGTQGIISPHPTLRRECIGHLAKLQGLHRLVMRGSHLAGLDHFLQTEITKVGRSPWPNIKDVQFPILPRDQQMGMQTTISLSTFCHLVQHCTNLVSFGGLITLPLYDNPDSLSAAFDKNPIPSGLKQLSTGSVEAREWNHSMIRVARFLEKLCPDLEKLTTHPEFSPTIWGNISGIVTALKEARREGRAEGMNSSSAN